MKRYLGLVVVSIFAFSSVVLADSDEKEEKRGFLSSFFKKFDEKKEYKRERVFHSELIPLYKNECGSCHMAYQPEFLPKRSWDKMMNNLEDHFKTDASLEKEDVEKIRKFLLANASDSKSIYGEYKEFYESIPSDKTLLRISQIPYFKKEHKKIDKKLITQKEVKSIANCTACHKDAQIGGYREKNIDIPNYGKWDD